MGGLLESFVVTELLKQQGRSDSDFTLSHYRDSMGGEIDIIAELADGSVWGLEVKTTQTPRSEHFKHLRKLRDRTGDRFRGGIVLNLHPRTVRMGPGFWSVPVSALWDH